MEARKFRARCEVKKQLLGLAAPSAHSHTLCLGNFLCQGPLMVSAAGQSTRESQAPRAAPCNVISIAAAVFTSVTHFLRGKAESTDLWLQGCFSKCLSDSACG